MVLAIVGVLALYAIKSAMQPGTASAKLKGTSGGSVPSPGEPQTTPEDSRRRNDFPAFSYLGGYTGGNLAPVNVEPVLLDPGDASLNQEVVNRNLGNFYSADHQLPDSYATTGLVGFSAAQTPENWQPPLFGSGSPVPSSRFAGDSAEAQIVGRL